MSTTDDPPLGEYLDAWLERRRTQLRATTLDSYEVVIRNYLRPGLGPTRLSDLDRRMIEGAYAKLLASGGRNGQSLSPRTVESAHRVLRSALEDARVDGLLLDNPAEHATPPRRDTRATEIDDGPQVWTAKQAREFLRHVEDHPLRALWHVAVGTGARRSELLGLRWKDVDLAGGTVLIRRALTVVKGVARLLRTKTSQGRRIAIAGSVVDALQRHRAELDRELQLAGDAWHNEWDLVFTEETGRVAISIRTRSAWSSRDSSASTTCQTSGCTISGTPTHRCCSVSACRSRSSASGWVTPRSRPRWTATPTFCHPWIKKQPRRWRRSSNSLMAAAVSEAALPSKWCAHVR